MARWLWNRHFAAVDSDNMAVEAMPPIIDGVEQLTHELILHQWCLSLDIPLDELWDLKTMVHPCKLTRQYLSMPSCLLCNFPGAVASLANALAIL